jgi:hypothetical protein
LKIAIKNKGNSGNRFLITDHVGGEMKKGSIAKYLTGMILFLVVFGTTGIFSSADAVTVRVEDVTARQGSTVTVRVFIDGSDREVASSGFTDIQAWSLSGKVLNSLSLDLDVTGVRLSPYILSQSPWFSTAQPAAGADGNVGFVSAVALSSTTPKTHAVGEHPVAEFDLHIPTDIPVGTIIPVIFFDGMTGTGQPVNNIFTANSTSYKFNSLLPGSITVLDSGTKGRIEDVTALPGSTATVRVFLDGSDREVNSSGFTDIQGWSLSGKILNSLSLGLEVIDVRLSPYILSQSPGFSMAQSAVGTDGNRGFVSAIVLSMVMPKTLAIGEHPVAEFDVSIPSDVPEGTVIPLIFFDGMQGSGQPVDNIVTTNGESNYLSLLTPGSITVGTTPVLGACADLNNDGFVDIADVILTLREALELDDTKLCLLP